MLPNKFKEILLIGWIGFFCLFPFRNDFNAPPKGVHTWAQADRYAVALGYLHGDPLLKPTTYALYTDQGRVGVEFSGTAWLSAQIAIIFRAETLLPGIFRFLSALWIILSLYFSSWLIFGHNFILRIIFALFCLSAPVLTYYAFNFIPDAHGFAFALTGFSCYLKFLKNHSLKFLLSAILLCTLGGLFKLSSALYLLAIMGHQLWIFIFQNRDRFVGYTLSAGIIGLTLISFYDYQYFIKINKELWSAVFMSAPNPVLSFKEWKDVWIGMLYWRSEYFLPMQYFILMPVLIIGIVRIRNSATYLSLVAILSIGFMAFLTGLGKQLIHHDYYVISAFYPFILGAFGVIMKYWTHRFPAKVLSLILIISLFLYFQSAEKVNRRTEEVYKFRKGEIRSDIAWLQNGKEMLDGAGLPLNERIFVLYDFAPNTSLVYLGRKGLVFNHEQMSRKEPHLEYWLDRIKPSCLVVPRLWDQQFARDKPQLKDSLHKSETTHFNLYFFPKHGY